MTETIVTCPICRKWHIEKLPGEVVQRVVDLLGQHVKYCSRLAALAVFQRMLASGDWEGQVSMGFAATFDQELTEAP